MQKLADELSTQSALALSCPHWQSRTAPPPESIKASNAPLAESASLPDDFGSTSKTDVDLSTPIPENGSWIRKLGRWLGVTPQDSSFQNRDQSSQSPANYSLKQLDRSGIGTATGTSAGTGAGTEPCLGCHGRIANLGALVVETNEGDKQTYSVWRCRNCAATYLNSWIDRWERLDNLETEETLYRIAPGEALLLLTRIHGIDSGDHPKERADRHQEREWFEAFQLSRTPISHQVRRGR